MVVALTSHCWASSQEHGESSDLLELVCHLQAYAGSTVEKERMQTALQYSGPIIIPVAQVIMAIRLIGLPGSRGDLN